MNPGEILTSGLQEIRHHKLRSFLTLTGVILGTGSILFMTSMLNGIILSVWDGIAELGYDGVLYVVQRTPRDAVERARFGQSEGLRPSDAAMLLKRRELVEAVAPVQIEEVTISRGSIRREVQVSAVTPDYAFVRRRGVALGRTFTVNDERSFAKVCILGHRLRLRLFGVEDPQGQEVLIGGQRFRVVGVGEELGNRFVNDSDFIQEMNGALVPLATFRRYFSGEDSPLSYIAVKTTRLESLGRVQAEIQASLSAAHHGIDDFRVQNIAQEMVRERDKVHEIVFNWQVVLGTIAGIALLVGGIGLLSVMLISINERLYEIGTRKAIGASDLEIFLMFLGESITLALVGALIGVGVGVALVKALASAFPSGLPIDWAGVAWAVGIAVSLGVLFGLYPAMKASRMSPVEAIRAG